jgi:hypothetical protein
MWPINAKAGPTAAGTRPKACCRINPGKWPPRASIPQISVLCIADEELAAKNAKSTKKEKGILCALCVLLRLPMVGGSPPLSP